MKYKLKRYTTFSHYHWDVLPEAMEAFLQSLALHELAAGIKQRLSRCF